MDYRFNSKTLVKCYMSELRTTSVNKPVGSSAGPVAAAQAEGSACTNLAPSNQPQSP
jgi:hypothetical protein